MGVQMRKLLRSRVVVVFGATSRIGRATIEALSATQPHHAAAATVVAAVERPKDARVQRLKRATACYVVRCDFADTASLRRAVRNADAVLLIPALSASGTRFSKRVIDAAAAEQVPRLVLVSSILATDDFWRPRGPTSAAARAPAPAATPDAGYEAVEAHARSVSENCVTLRIPLLMETLLYCRDEVLFANRVVSCFGAATQVPCIAVADVARAASEVVTQLDTKFHATYCLAHADVTVSPAELEHMLTQALGRRIQYRQVNQARLAELLQDKGASEQVAMNMARLKTYLEATATETTASAGATAVNEHHDNSDASSSQSIPQPHAARNPRARLGFTNDFRTLTKRALQSPQQWLVANGARFLRTPQTQMQLFVIGSGEGLFQEIERFVAQQVTAPLAISPPADVGEAAIPTTTGASTQSKTTFCTMKTIPGGRQRHTAVLSGQQASPVSQVLAQLSAMDVVLFIPPLRFGADECLEIMKVVVDAAKLANVWGIVFVSSIFTARGWSDSVNRMGTMEQYLEKSGVSYAIVRLPLFMEYFLALAAPSSSVSPLENAVDAQLDATGVTEEEKEPEPMPPSEAEQTRTAKTKTRAHAAEPWTLLDKSLASSPQYLIATADAAKALVAVAYTFPLHRNKIRTVYTECRTMRDVEATLQHHAVKGARIDFDHVDALQDAPNREFWRIAYWPKSHVKQFLETSVQLSANRAPLEMNESFDELTECQPMTLDKWARRNAKCYSHALRRNGASKSTSSSTVYAASPPLRQGSASAAAAAAMRKLESTPEEAHGDDNSDDEGFSAQTDDSKLRQTA